MAEPRVLVDVGSILVAKLLMAVCGPKVTTGVLGVISSLKEPACPFPAPFTGVTVYVVSAKRESRLPEITQVELLIVTPAGRAGVILQAVIALPLSTNDEGEIDIASSTLKVLVGRA